MALRSSSAPVARGGGVAVADPDGAGWACVSVDGAASIEAGDGGEDVLADGFLDGTSSPRVRPATGSNTLRPRMPPTVKALARGMITAPPCAGRLLIEAPFGKAAVLLTPLRHAT